VIYDAQKHPVINRYIDLSTNYLETIEKSIPLSNVRDLLT